MEFINRIDTQTPVQIFYWKSRARAYVACVLTQAAGLTLDWHGDFNIPISQEELLAITPNGPPFMQLPFMIHGDVKIAQSMAITRYIAKIGGLDGNNPAEFAFSEMLIEEVLLLLYDSKIIILINYFYSIMTFGMPW